MKTNKRKLPETNINDNSLLIKKAKIKVNLPVTDLVGSNFQGMSVDNIADIVSFLITIDQKSAIALSMVSKFFNKIVTLLSNENFYDFLQEKIQEQSITLSSPLTELTLKNKMLLKELLIGNSFSNNNQSRFSYFDTVAEQLGKKIIKELVSTALKVPKGSANLVEHLKKFFAYHNPDLLRLIIINFPAMRVIDDSEFYYRTALKLGYLFCSQGSLDALAVYYGIHVYSNDVRKELIGHLPLLPEFDKTANEFLLQWCRENLIKSFVALGPEKTHTEEIITKFMRLFLRNKALNGLLTKIPLISYVPLLGSTIEAAIKEKKLNRLYVLEQTKLGRLIDFYKLLYGRKPALASIKEKFPQFDIHQVVNFSLNQGDFTIASTYVQKLTQVNYLMAIEILLKKQFGDKIKRIPMSELWDNICEIINKNDKTIGRLIRRFEGSATLPLIMEELIIEKLCKENLAQLVLFSEPLHSKWAFNFIQKIKGAESTPINLKSFYQVLTNLTLYFGNEMGSSAPHKELCKIDLNKIESIWSTFSRFYREESVELLAYLGVPANFSIITVSRLINIFNNYQNDPTTAMRKLVTFGEEFIRNNRPRPAPTPAPTRAIVHPTPSIASMMPPSNRNASPVLANNLPMAPLFNSNPANAYNFRLPNQPPAPVLPSLEQILMEPCSFQNIFLPPIKEEDEEEEQLLENNSNNNNTFNSNLTL